MVASAEKTGTNSPKMTSSVGYLYDKVRSIFDKTPGERSDEDVAFIDPWFRKKSNLFEGLKSGKCEGSEAWCFHRAIVATKSIVYNRHRQSLQRYS